MAQPMHDPPELDTPSPDDEWLEALIEWADEAAGTEFDGTAEPADVLAYLVDGATFHRAPPEQATRWTVTDDGSAEWAMGHVLRADQALAELQAQAQVWRDEADERIRRIAQWFAHGAKRHLATRAFMDAHLSAYALDRRAADPKHNKTLVLPSGVVKTTEAKPKAEVVDPDAVVAWAVQLGGERLADIAPEQPRKLYVNALRDNTDVVEVIDHAQLLLASGELIEWVRDGWESSYVPPATAWLGKGRCPQPSDGWPTPETATDLVARVEVLASHLEVHGPDGLPVPGTHVVPGTVTTKVVPAP